MSLKNHIIEGLKIIRHNVSGVDVPDDPAFPFKLEGNFGPPEFMDMDFALFALVNCRREEFVVRAMTKEALDKFIETCVRERPRLRRMVITGPDGLMEEIKGR